jgi:hypothetical protein
MNGMNWKKGEQEERTKEMRRGKVTVVVVAEGPNLLVSALLWFAPCGVDQLHQAPIPW